MKTIGTIGWIKDEGMKNSWTPGTPVESNAYNWDEEPVLTRAESPQDDDAPTMVDLFSGCGGFSTGFAQAGFRSLVALDVHPPSLTTLAQNHPHTDTILGDIRRVSDDDMLGAVAGRRVDVVSAGVPCQGFSRTNRKRWDGDERNFLFEEFIRMVRLLGPPAVLLENVSGIRTAANGGFVRAIASAIEQSGYTVEARVLNAADFGVPQRRQRVFFIGLRPGTRIRWPAATFGSEGNPHRSVSDAIGDLPQIGPGEAAHEYVAEPETDYQRFMRKEAGPLLNHVAPKHPQAVIERIANTVPGEPMYPRFRQRIRLHPDRPSPTQVCGGIRPQFQFGHPTMPRGLTVRERARIQSFPDDYFITGGTVQGRVQTGNAVPPLLAQAVAEQILGALRGYPADATTDRSQASQMALL